MNKPIQDFISTEEQNEIIHWARTQDLPTETVENEHVKAVHTSIDGFSVLHNFTKTDIATYISKFQGDSRQIDSVPEVLSNIRDRIAKKFSLDASHTFVQLIVMGKEGYVTTHYDAGIDGYITYKCNMNVVGPDEDTVYIDTTKITVRPKELYAFEANLFKHWVSTCGEERIVLSYGFLVPYADLEWELDDPRIRMAQRIAKKFMSGYSSSSLTPG